MPVMRLIGYAKILSPVKDVFLAPENCMTSFAESFGVRHGDLSEWRNDFQITEGEIR